MTRHGSESTYSKLRCRCMPCREAHRVMVAATRKRTRARGLAPGDHRHGTISGYDWWGCRCPLCRQAGLIKHQHDYAVETARLQAAKP